MDLEDLSWPQAAGSALDQSRSPTMTINFDSFRKILPARDPRACWEVSYRREPEGWEVRVRKKSRMGWGPEVIFYLIGNDIHVHDALRAYDQHRGKV
ncbi:hypothetical protein [Luteimonas sp. SDU101]|uniref:hypothetical protein n=1 Tax=Luteimonas sp. SDU101 TaxID=3422593 RepID=UPI003EBE2A65